MNSSILKSRLADLIRPDGVGPVCCDEHEILQRIFVTVRDQNWREITPTDSKSEIDEQAGVATLTVRHESDSVEFEWRGTLRVSDDRRRLHFEFSGRALRDMQVCRVGLVVLHPIQSMVGARVIAVGHQSGHELTPSETIAPQPVANGIPLAMTEPFFKLVIERADFGELELTFEGDLFELEDQRNWGDMSFKTYCTPLRLGFPRELKAGTVIEHSMEVRFTPSRIQSKTTSAGYRSGVFPQLGLDWSRSGWTARASDQIRPNWSHLHFDAGRLEDPAELREVFAAEATAPLHVGFEVQTDVHDEAIALFVEHRKRIARLLLYGHGTSLPSATAISGWQLRLQNAAEDWDIPISAGTRGHFVELNRGTRFDLPVSGIAFPLTATVHSDDAETICGNVRAIQDMARTGLRLTGVDQISTIPLALYHPPSRLAQSFPATLVAPWLAATLIHAALGGVDTVTLACNILDSLAATGPQGIRLISRLADFKDREIAGFGGLPPPLHAMKFTAAPENEPQVLVANVNSSAVEISLGSLGKGLRTAINAVSDKALILNGSGLIIPGHAVILLGY